MVAMEMKRYNISLLGIAETRWIQSGKFRLTTGKILYSGHTHDRVLQTKGVDLCYPDRPKSALIGREPVSSRIITATFKMKQTRILTRFIMCYAPTNNT